MKFFKNSFKYQKSMPLFILVMKLYPFDPIYLYLKHITRLCLNVYHFLSLISNICGFAYM